MDRRGVAYLPLTAEVVAAHLVGDVFIGLYPLRTGNTCHFLVADFDGPAAMLDALAYCKAARASSVPAVLEISQSGRGAHAWVFFTDAVTATVARAVGTTLLHEAMVLRGSMDLRSYDRLFPNQDVLPEGGFGNPPSVLPTTPSVFYARLSKTVTEFRFSGGEEDPERELDADVVTLGSRSTTCRSVAAGRGGIFCMPWQGFNLRWGGAADAHPPLPVDGVALPGRGR